jgi:uncharacterized protein YjlB
MDMRYGKPGERPAADERIARVGLPRKDPLHGADGPLSALWRGEDSRAIGRDSFLRC